MALLGVESLIYGVDSLDEAARFHDDFGLVAERRGDDGLDYVLEDGSMLLLRRNDDPALPPEPFRRARRARGDLGRRQPGRAGRA